MKLTEWKKQWGLSLQHNINMRSQAVRELAGDWGLLVKQLQISDWHFAFLVASLAHQPVWIHAWNTADCDHLDDRHSPTLSPTFHLEVYCLVHQYQHKITHQEHGKHVNPAYNNSQRLFQAHLVSQQGELAAAGSIVVIKHSGFAAAVGAPQFVESAWCRRAAVACGHTGQGGRHRDGGHRDAGRTWHGWLVVVWECRGEAGGRKRDANCYWRHPQLPSVSFSRLIPLM